MGPGASWVRCQPRRPLWRSQRIARPAQMTSRVPCGFGASGSGWHRTLFLRLVHPWTPPFPHVTVWPNDSLCTAWHIACTLNHVHNIRNDEDVFVVPALQIPTFMCGRQEFSKPFLFPVPGGLVRCMRRRRGGSLSARLMSGLLQLASGPWAGGGGGASELCSSFALFLFSILMTSAQRSSEAVGTAPIMTAVVTFYLTMQNN